MAANRVNGSRNGTRAGAQTLVLLATPINLLVLRSLQEGAKRHSELLRATGAPAQTTLRAQLKRLASMGAIEKHRQSRFPRVLEYELIPPGEELLVVADTIEAWLEKGPGERVRLGDNTARAAIKALAESWSTTMLRALAAGPLSLTELDGIIAGLSYPALERRLAALRLAGLVEARQGGGRSTPYAITRWLRQGIAPLAAAAHWERRHAGETAAPIGRLDVEAAFLLAVPLLRLPTGVSGRCRLAVEIAGSRDRLAGVTVEIEDGRVTSCSTPLRVDAGAWALGTPAAWLDAVVGTDAKQLELGGDCRLAAAVVAGLHRALLPGGAPSPA